MVVKIRSFIVLTLIFHLFSVKILSNLLQISRFFSFKSFYKYKKRMFWSYLFPNNSSLSLMRFFLFNNIANGAVLHPRSRQARGKSNYIRNFNIHTRSIIINHFIGIQCIDFSLIHVDLNKSSTRRMQQNYEEYLHIWSQLYYLPLRSRKNQIIIIIRIKWKALVHIPMFPRVPLHKFT